MTLAMFKINLVADWKNQNKQMTLAMSKINLVADWQNQLWKNPSLYTVNVFELWMAICLGEAITWWIACCNV
jgi:hypothetical protein